MPESLPAAEPRRFKTEAVAWLIAALIRLLGCTLRIRMHDEGGYFTGAHGGRYLFAFWHNRMCVMPVVYRRFYGNRMGAVVLTSPSGDGALLARVVAHFGMGAVRGSSSRRGARALREMTDTLAKGNDIIVTPDGPRGPRYQLGQGLIFVAAKTGFPIMPIYVEYSRCFRLKSWDRFMIPLPFSRAEVTLGKLFFVTGDDLEAQRLELQNLMQPATP